MKENYNRSYTNTLELYFETYISEQELSFLSVY